jgi:hypothetical protein
VVTARARREVVHATVERGFGRDTDDGQIFDAHARIRFPQEAGDLCSVRLLIVRATLTRRGLTPLSTGHIHPRRLGRPYRESLFQVLQER